MCGIVGVVNGKGATSVRSDVCKYMEHGTLTGMLRGADSTGMFQVSPSGGVKMHKLPVDGYMFRSSMMFSRLSGMQIPHRPLSCTIVRLPRAV